MRVRLLTTNFTNSAEINIGTRLASVKVFGCLGTSSPTIGEWWNRPEAYATPDLP